jgi:NADH:ubiquinone oxidoreductase subunit F (NADH-binding)
VPRDRRVLDPEPTSSLAGYEAGFGGQALAAARAVEPAAVIDAIDAAGLRGRGGAGFPTATKWQTVAAASSPADPATVVVNAAEGEPGTFKDRSILRRNPYRVLEGALIAAHAVGADRIVVGTKATFRRELAILVRAVEELRRAKWTAGVAIDVIAGPDLYLLGEETALLEAIAGRPPFPRVAPPYRHGVDETGDAASGAGATLLASEGHQTPAAPTLVNNVETLANVPGIVERGAGWFRSAGTEDSPGTIVCTVSGSVVRAGVAEVAMGTPLEEVVRIAGGGPAGPVRAIASGAANPLLPAGGLSAPVSYEGLAAAGGGLGSAGFIVFDDSVDLVAVAHGMARFLGVESCGQCEPCKRDGLGLAEVFERLRTNTSEPVDLAMVGDLASTVADGARCYLATQLQVIVESLLAHFPDALAAHAQGRAAAVEPYLIAPLVDIVDGVAVLDDAHRDRQPDWTTDPTFSGQTPADRIDVAQALAPRTRTHIDR